MNGLNPSISHLPNQMPCCPIGVALQVRLPDLDAVKRAMA